MVGNIWTAEDRNAWIGKAVNSEYTRGTQHPYMYKVISKLEDCMIDQDDPKRAMSTEALADVLYNSNPAYRLMSLGLYHQILDRIRNNGFLRFHMSNMMVLLKGSNAYAMLLPGHGDELPFSDLDIVILINPNLPDEIYDKLRGSMRILVFQCMSQHKKTLDNMFFCDNPDVDLKNRWMSNENIEEFKVEHIHAMQKIGMVSPFTSYEYRNMASRHSFILTRSNAHADKVVKVETPHYDMCDRIPLRKSPIFCSFNDTINFVKDGYVRDFELCRIRFNNIHEIVDSVAVELTPDIESGGISLKLQPCSSGRYERITSDFIDISINGKYDTENLDFWMHGRCMMVHEPVVNTWVTVPDVQSCIRDIWKMLYIYDCPQSKREKRMRKIKVLMDIMEASIQVPRSLTAMEHAYSLADEEMSRVSPR